MKLTSTEITRVMIASSWNFKPNENQYYYSVDGIIVETDLKKGVVYFWFNKSRLLKVLLIVSFLVVNSKFINHSTLKINNFEINISDDEEKLFFQAKPYLTDNNKCEFWFSYKEDIIIEFLEEGTFCLIKVNKNEYDSEFSDTVLKKINLARKEEGLPILDIKKSHTRKRYYLA